MNPAIVRDDAAAVAVNEATDEFFGGFLDEDLLPGLETDRPGVLLAGAVLWEEARPVLGIQHDLDAPSAFPHDGRALTWHQRVDCLAAARND